MRHLEVLTEEPSMAITLEMLLSKHLPETTEYRILEFSGIENFFARLPDRLRGYRDWVPPEYKIILLADRDSEDCLTRKDRMESIAVQAGFATKAKPSANGDFSVVSRLAIEELEAWFFGDFGAVLAAYPRVPVTLASKESFRNSDSIRGGTAEALLRVLQESGYYKGLKRLPKLEVARRIGEHLKPERNTSDSFRVFWDTLIAL